MEYTTCVGQICIYQVQQEITNFEHIFLYQLSLRDYQVCVVRMSYVSRSYPN